MGQLTSMHFYGWKRGLRTTYYLRTQPATQVIQFTVDQSVLNDIFHFVLARAVARHAPEIPGHGDDQAEPISPSLCTCRRVGVGRDAREDGG